MRLLIVGIGIAGIMMLGVPGTVCADELAELKTQMKAMEERHQKELVEFQERLSALEAKEKPQLTRGVSTTPDAVAVKVAELEEEVAYLQDQQNAVLSSINEKVNFDMYVTLEVENFERNDASFDARNVEFLASAKMTDRLTGFTEIEFERLAVTSDGTTTLDRRAGEVEVEQAWLEYYINEYVRPRFGVILVPFGRFNLEHFDPLTNLTPHP